MKKIFLILTLCLFLSGCIGTSPDGRHALAVSIAGGMTEKYVEATPFRLTSWQKISSVAGSATIYIEGDGLAWVTRNKISNNPTPTNPVALKLAAADSAASNIIYLARPCQYSGRLDNSLCDETFWTRGKTSNDVVQAYIKALDVLKQVHGFSGFHLVGYSGGAAIAVLVAGQRDDVLSIRTVAGNISYQAFDALHQTTPASESIDPMTGANAVMNIPQLHFIGADDDIVTPALYDAWKAASAEKDCLTSALVPDTGHEKGWERAWPELLRQPLPTCP